MDRCQKNCCRCRKGLDVDDCGTGGGGAGVCFDGAVGGGGGGGACPSRLSWAPCAVVGGGDTGSVAW